MERDLQVKDGVTQRVLLVVLELQEEDPLSSALMVLGVRFQAEIALPVLPLLLHFSWCQTTEAGPRSFRLAVSWWRPKRHCVHRAKERWAVSFGHSHAGGGGGLELAVLIGPLQAHRHLGVGWVLKLDVGRQGLTKPLEKRLTLYYVVSSSQRDNNARKGCW